MRAVYSLLSLCVALAVVALVLPVLAQSRAVPAETVSFETIAALSPADRVRAGELDCPGCDFTGEDLANQCVKEGNLRGAIFDRVSAHYMCMSYADFSGASFRDADLTGVNLAHSDLSGADLSGAKLDIAALLGTDLATAKGLTQAQLDVACANAETKLPPGLVPRTCS